MSIQVGDKIPSVTLKRLGAEGLEEVKTDDLFGGRKVIMFSVPGAFTPTCHNTHLPQYIASADEIKAMGVDEIVCLAVNDPFVMKAWGEVVGATGKVTMLPDGNCELTGAMGLTFDGSGALLGTRGRRFALIAEDGVVKSIGVEEGTSEVGVSGAAACKANLS